MSSTVRQYKYIASSAALAAGLLLAVSGMLGQQAGARVLAAGVTVPQAVPTQPPTAIPSGTSVLPDQTTTPIVPGPVPTSPPGGFCNASFSDVQVIDWFSPYVQWMFCTGVASGYSDGSFRPGNTTTRSQAAKIIVLASGWQLVNPAAPSFSDVAPASTFYTYIETAAQHGTLGGYPDGTFRPVSYVTRGQFAKLAVLSRGWALLNPSVASFSDVPSGSPFFQYIETAASKGVLGGYNDGTFRPDSNSTRAQMSKMAQLAFTTP